MLKTPQKRWVVTICTTTTEGVEYSSAIEVSSQKDLDRILKDAREQHLLALLALSGLPTLKHLEMAVSPHPNYDTRRKHSKILEELKYDRMFPRLNLKISIQPV